MMGKKVVFNEEQLAELRKMMDDCVPQLQIAAHFKVTDDTIRRICRENNMQIHMPHKCVCKLCGETFYSNIKTATICKKEHHRTCVICGKDFIVDRTDIRETCSRECTNLLKYGVDHPWKSDVVKEKRKETLLRERGVENISQDPEVREKVRQTNFERYGNWYSATEEGRAKIRAANLEKYGYKEPFGDVQKRAEFAQIKLERYGDEHPMRTEAIKQKQRATVMKNHNGVDNPMKDPEVVETFQRNYREKHGVNSPSQLPEVKQKISDTCMKKFDVPWACMRPEARNFTNDSKPNRDFAALLEENQISYQREFYIPGLNKYSYDFKIDDHILIEIDPSGTHNTLVNIRVELRPISVDYHLKKSQAAQENGYRCIHVFDWDDPQRVIDLLKQKEVIYARKCEVRSVDKETAELFTGQHHLQGSCKGQVNNLGLYFNDELVQVMTFGNPRYNRKYDLELLRLCSKTGLKVIGGASKLFNHFVKENTGLSIISYCDASKFTGDVYSQIGMKLEYRTDPNITWSKGKKRITDNLLRQRGFDQIFSTNYGKGTSNVQLMIDHKWLPVCDCGQMVFSYYS